MNMSIDKTWVDRNPSLRGMYMSCTCLQIFLFRGSYSYYGDVLIWFPCFRNFKSIHYEEKVEPPTTTTW